MRIRDIIIQQTGFYLSNKFSSSVPLELHRIHSGEYAQQSWGIIGNALTPKGDQHITSPNNIHQPGNKTSQT